MGIGPEPAVGFPGLRLGLHQIGIGGKPAKHPGMPFRHHLAVDIALIDPERGQHPPILVESATIDPHALSCTASMAARTEGPAGAAWKKDQQEARRCASVIRAAGPLTRSLRTSFSFSSCRAAAVDK